MGEPARGGFLEELKRRKVVRVAVVYLAAAFAALEVAELLFPLLEVPEWGLRLVLGLAAVGFPIAVALAWAFEVTPEGVRRTIDDPAPDTARDVESAAATSWLSRHSAGAALTLVVLAGSLGWLVGGRSAGSDRGAALEASIAVLPFTNTSGDPENDGFTNGLHDDLLTHLSRIGSLKVISRTSVMAYRGTTKTLPEIGRELGVAVVLEGGVQRSGDQIRVNAQLIDARTDEHLWADIYDERISVESLLGIQAAIARRIAESLSATLTPAEERALVARPTENARAYEHYLRGNEALRRFRLAYDQAGFDEAAREFRQALALDPAFAAARAGLAYTLVLASPDSARALAREALAGDSTLVPALLAMAGSYGMSREPGARRLQAEWVEAAARIAPTDPDVLYTLAWVRLGQERYGEMLEIAERLRDLDPRNILPDEILSSVLTMTRRYQEVLDVLARDEPLLVRTAEEPIWAFEAHRLKALVALDGDTRRALQALEAFHARFPATPAQLGGRLDDLPELLRDGDFDEAVLSLSADHQDESRRCACEAARAWVHQLRGRESQALALWSRLADRRLAGEEARSHSGEAARRGFTAVVLARAGRAAQARAEMERAWALDSELQSWDRTGLRQHRAMLFLALGAHEEALAEIEHLLSVPSEFSVGWLRASPVADPLRADPRFEALLERFGRTG